MIYENYIMIYAFDVYTDVCIYKIVIDRVLICSRIK